jgi:Fic family protein
MTISQFAEMGKISYNTARTDIEHLGSTNILIESDIQARPQIYNVLEIAYGD